MLTTLFLFPLLAQKSSAKPMFDNENLNFNDENLQNLGFDDYAFTPDTCWSCPEKTFMSCFLQHADPLKFISCDNGFEKVMNCPENFTWSVENEYCQSSLDNGITKINPKNGLEYNEAMNAFVTPMNIRLQTESRTGSLIINKQDPNFKNICSKCPVKGSEGLPYSCYMSALIDTQFYECNVGVPKLLACPPNTVWNNRFQTCLKMEKFTDKNQNPRVKANKKGRTSRSSPYQINKSHHVCDYCHLQGKNLCLYPNSDNESQYFSCLKQEDSSTYKFALNQCEKPNQVYKQNLQACVEKMSEIQSRVVEIDQINSDYKEKCAERCNKNSSNSESCVIRMPDETQYLECFKGIPVVHNCPIGYVYDEIKGYCVNSNPIDYGFLGSYSDYDLNDSNYDDMLMSFS